MSELRKEIDKLNKNDIYPFHMPGHKRSDFSDEMGKYYDIDITEIDDYDNLHDAEGIILDAQKRANRLYGALETFFLVNGSTSGILAAISAAVEKNGVLFAGRNSHKALYHAAYLREADLEYLMPETKILKDNDNNPVAKLLGEITAAEVERAFKEKGMAGVVFVTSPTYDGITCNIEEIAEVVHRNKALLIVDEAHGAHFGFDKNLPESAVKKGADIVIHSVHKTLASMTQTALIHVCSDRVDREKLRRFLRIYQSSSPSYVLMSSIDASMADIENKGREVFGRLLENRKRIEEKTRDCKKIYIPDMSEIEDPCKILICVREVTGQKLYDILRLEYKLQLEMASDTYALAIITGYDSSDGIDRLIDAINDIDKRICRLADNKGTEKLKNSPEETGTITGKDNKCINDFRLPEKIIPFAKAWDAPTEDVDITVATGRIAGEFINLYPPGIPLIVPGERISKELVLQIEKYINDGLNVQGITKGRESNRLIRVIKRD